LSIGAAREVRLPTLSIVTVSALASPIITCMPFLRPGVAGAREKVATSAALSIWMSL